MSDPDRGAYTPPTDAPLSFDARRPVRGGPPVPMTLVISAVILIALIAAVFFFYRSGVRGANDAPQPVGEPVGAITSPAPPEAQPADPAAGLQIYQTDEIPNAEPTFTPGPEQPAARPTTPVEAKPLPQPQAQPKPAPVAVAEAPPPPPKPAPAPPPKPAPVATGSFSVQIGAFSSQALADKGWNDAARVAPGSAAGKGKKVEAVERDGQTLYRTTMTGFATKADASAFCDQLKAAGKGCFVR